MNLLKLVIFNRSTFTIGEHLNDTQPATLEQIKKLICEVEEEEFTPFQRYLDRLMRQPPRPGRGSGI